MSAHEVAPRPEINRVLIYRLGSLGDTIVALPSFHLIARAFPTADRRLLTNFPVHAKAPAAAAVMGNSGLVSGYIGYPVGLRNPREVLRLMREIRTFRPEVLVYLAALRGARAIRRDRLFFRLCGVRETVGLPRSKEEMHPRCLPGSKDLEWESMRLARSIASLGNADLDSRASWDLRLTQEERAPAARAFVPDGRPFIAVCVGTKMQAKDWGESNWTALLTRLAESLTTHRLVMIGAKEEAEASARAAAAWRERAVNLCGLGPRESAAILEDAALFIGHDSGPMHLAAAVDTPCVAVFAARHAPRIWFPYGPKHRVIYHQTDCFGCGLETCIAQRKKCILSVTVDEVLSAVFDALGAAREKRLDILQS